jgi:hypothetical protein
LIASSSKTISSKAIVLVFAVFTDFVTICTGLADSSAPRMPTNDLVGELQEPPKT